MQNQRQRLSPNQYSGANANDVDRALVRQRSQGMEQRNLHCDKDSRENNTVQRDSVESNSSYVSNDELCGNEDTLLLVQKANYGGSNDERSYMDQVLVDHTLHQGPRSGTFVKGINPASDPGTMLTAMKEGDKRLLKAREVLGDSANRTTTANGISEQVLTRIDEKDVSIPQGLAN